MYRSFSSQIKMLVYFACYFQYSCTTDHIISFFLPLCIHSDQNVKFVLLIFLVLPVFPSLTFKPQCYTTAACHICSLTMLLYILSHISVSLITLANFLKWYIFATVFEIILFTCLSQLRSLFITNIQTSIFHILRWNNFYF